ncbi:hypothetical protein CDAR_35881 [Caerostris darwini]|uniref:Uncharacterized protein n=1 Tax=Caerostris darwini TaxID=1538125 RepID=A0AAV4TIK3_9ARAC|nr:hypothetical protein CDAR_35881 [Caerostris darwini]
MLLTSREIYNSSGRKHPNKTLNPAQKVFETLLTLSGRSTLSRESSGSLIPHHHDAEEQGEGDLHPDTLHDLLGAPCFARESNSCSLLRLKSTSAISGQ